MDVFAVCLSQNSLFSGSLDKLLSTRQSSVGYLPSVSELKAGTDFTSNYLTLVSEAPSENATLMVTRDKDVDYRMEISQKNFELPRMPPWFVYVGSPKLYQALAGILRLVGLSSIAGCFNSCNSSSLFSFMYFLFCTYTSFCFLLVARLEE